MPELPEVETVRRGLTPAMEGRTILAVDQRRADLRFPFPERFAERLAGRRVVALGRRAKYLLADLDDGAVLVMHLGMSGSFRIEQEGEDPPEAANGAAIGIGRADGDLTPATLYHATDRIAAHDHVVFRLEGETRVTYNDPRRFGFMDLVPRAGIETHRFFAGLGPEPTGNALSPDHLDAAFAGRMTTLKAALLDQRLVAGLGNIYVCEALWRAGLSPFTAAGTLSGPGAAARGARDRLAAAIGAVIAEAIEAGGSSLRDHRQTDGSLGYFQHRFAVYDRAGHPCPRPGCAGTVARVVQSGRSTFHCAACQG